MSGVGCGGNAGRDQQRQKKGTQAAQKRESKTWSKWQKDLQAFCKQRHDQPLSQAPPSNLPLDTLKQALRCQAPNWWWKNPQRKMHLTALQVCAILTEHYPQNWGDVKDAESPIAALEEMAQASTLLAKELDKENHGNDTKPNNNANANNKKNKGVLATTAATLSSWISSPTSSNHDTHDKDAELPLKVIEMRDQALTVALAELEKLELSMLGSHDYCRQVLGPLAIDTVEAFDKPKHCYDGKAAAQHCASHNYPGHYSKKKKPPAKTNNDNGGLRASAAVLWKELSTYPTALSIEFGSSIFVRAVENQMDELSVAIVGPDYTPCANGVFMFDVLMGSDHSHVPPRVQFLTTSNFLSASDKKVRFNPNSHAD